MPESMDTPESVETLSGCDLVSILMSSEEQTFSWHVVDFFFMILWLDSRKGCCKSSIALSVIPKRYTNVFAGYFVYLNATTIGCCQLVAASLGYNAKNNFYTGWCIKNGTPMTNLFNKQVFFNISNFFGKISKETKEGDISLTIWRLAQSKYMKSM